ncbi:hypothetical protein ACIBBB_06875 [Streptomyces sp. NPDC051217]|uniref:SbtR family transcriptional regulator n=1 Tax=Streptomyces sp. NPDC051217 TaxID=3365644 RepID=UPI00379A6B49
MRGRPRARAGSAEPPLRGTARASAVAPDVTVADLVTPVTGITLATEQHPDPVAGAHRLLELTGAGIGPRR